MDGTLRPPRRRLLGLAAALAMACGPQVSDEKPRGGLADLIVDAPRAGESARVIWEFFEPESCAIVEGCIAAPGWRRVMRFETFTGNYGSGDLVMGAPGDHPQLFSFSACHRHYHYDGYADYRLLNAAGQDVGFGHKQAFCLEDTSPVSTDPSVSGSPRYNCDFQGISRGWGDSYNPGLDCQWIDVTDVAPGSYTLRIAINESRGFPEHSYDNNLAEVPVSVPNDAVLDPTAACPNLLDGPRDCGWSVSGASACAPGARLRVGCGAACSLGTCSGDPILRVCPGEGPCSSRDALAFNDDGCGNSLCPLTTFTCPASGGYTVITAPYRVGQAYTCQLATSAAVAGEPAPPPHVHK